MRRARFIIFRDGAGKYRWRLRAKNGEIVATSQAYSSRQAARKGIWAARKAAVWCYVEDATETTHA